MANRVEPDKLASKKPADLDLHSLQRQGIFGFNRIRIDEVSAGYSLGHYGLFLRSLIYTLSSWL